MIRNLGQSIDKIDQELTKVLSNANIAYSKKDYTKAILYYEKALILNPNLPQAYLKIGNICLELSALNDALFYYEKVLQLEKNNFIAYCNIGTVFQKNNQLEEAKEYYLKSIKINPNYVHAHYNLSYILLMQKNYLEGFNKYRYRYHKEIMGSRQGGVAYPPTLLTPEDNFQDKVLYISHEQGLGDTIEFIRFLPFFTKKAKQIICYVPPSLVKLFQFNYPSVDFIPPNSNISFDFNFPLLEAPYVLKITYETLPFQDKYLSVKKEDLFSFQKKHSLDSSKIKIGINYKGSQGKDAVKNRSLDLELLLQYLSKLPQNYSIFSLQYERTNQEDKLLEAYQIQNLGQYIENFYDTALMIEGMDIIISIDTSFLHLAGALGKKTFALLKFDPDWRWGLDENHINWYSNMTLLRQASANDWDSVLTPLVSKLKVENM